MLPDITDGQPLLLRHYAAGRLPILLPAVAMPTYQQCETAE